MYYYLFGELSYLDLNTCVIDCGGVGYKLTISTLTQEALGAKMGDKVRLYTHLAVREDGIELFGFISEDERLCFNRLTSVSGVGPKAGINILSALSPSELFSAISTENIKAIARAQGIGNKTAARIVLELRDKIGDGISIPDTDSSQKTVIASKTNKNLSDAVEALMSLGYGKPEILNAVSGIDTAKTPVGEIVRLALKKLMK